VLRDVALHHEPRVLSAPATVSRPSAESGAHAPQVDTYRAQAEAAGAYQLGHEAGRAEAEGELQGAREQALQAGFREGFTRGLEEGRSQGLAEGREAGRQAVEREARAAQDAVVARLTMLGRLLAELPAEMGRRLASAEDDMIALSHAAICRILGEQLVTRVGVAQVVAQAIREAGGGGLPSAADRQPLSVHAHPSDIATLQADDRIAAWMAGSAHGGPAPVRWVSDERVAVGGCLVRSTEGTLDARLEVQLEALRQLLLEARGSDAGRSRSLGAADGVGPDVAREPQGATP
jgi:flagellar assembly protein FliH